MYRNFNAILTLVTAFFAFIALPNLFTNPLEPVIEKTVITSGSRETLKNIKEKIISDIEKGIIPSVSISVSKDGNVIWQEAFGWTDKIQRRAVTPETIYSLASLSKPLTATGVMLLFEKGKIDLNESIEKYISPITLKSYAYDSRKATVKHLLNHTSGLPMHYNYFYADEEAIPQSFEESLDKYGFIIDEPGSSFRYSNLGYGLLGFAISKISQMPFEHFMEREIFKPLGMNNTTFNIKSFDKKDVATRYDSEGNALPGIQCDTPGAAHAYSSSGDLMRFALFLLGNEIKGSESILTKNSIKKILSEQSNSSKNPHINDAYYCLGLFSRQHKAGFTEIWHEGGWDGASSMLKIIPEKNIAVITLINTYNSGYVQELTNEIAAATMGLNKEEKEGLAPGPTNITKPKMPNELIGIWKGEIKTYAGSIPIMMNFMEGGYIYTSTGDQKELANNYWFHLIELRDSKIFGCFQKNIPTNDAMRYSHYTCLEVEKKGEKLIGVAIAWKNERKLKRMYSNLSHYVELIQIK